MNKFLYNLIVTACAAFFCYEAYLNFDIYFKYPTSKTYSQKFLHDVEFPMIEICLEMGYNEEFLKSQGYANLVSYAMGMSGQSFIGWGGNESLTTNVLLDKSYAWRNLTDVIQSIRVNNNSADVLEVPMQYPEGKCFSVNGDKISQKQNTNMDVFIYFKSVNNTVAKISVTDPHRMTFKREIFSFSGNIIEKDITPNQGQEKSTEVYNIQVSERVDFEKDQEANCKDYTGTSGETYKNCFSAELEKKYGGILGCTPPWFARSYDSHICKGKFQGEEGYNGMDIIEDMDISGFEVGYIMKGILPKSY